MHERTLRLYEELLRLRRADPVLADPGSVLDAQAQGTVLRVERRIGSDRRILVVNFSDQLAKLAEGVQEDRAPLVASSPIRGGRLAPWGAAIFASRGAGSAAAG
jgi:hypothetical protein